MGCSQSRSVLKRVWPLGNGNVGGGKAPKPAAVQSLEERTKLALQEIILYRMEHAKDASATASFNRIILKFPAIRAAFASIKTVFKRFDVDGNGSIDSRELGNAMASLGAKLTPEAVNAMVRAFCYASFSVYEVFPTML